MGNYSFLRVFFLCFSPPENLVYNTKTRLSQVKSFFVVCAKETNRRKWKGTIHKKKKEKEKRKQQGEKVYNIERVINYKSTFLFSFWCLGKGRE